MGFHVLDGGGRWSGDGGEFHHYNAFPTCSTRVSNDGDDDDEDGGFNVVRRFHSMRCKLEF